MASINMYSFLMVFGLQCLGAFEHFRFSKAQGNISGSFFSYLFSNKPGSTATTYILLGASAWASCEAGIADNINPQLLYNLIKTGNMPVASFAAAGLSLVTGYGFDSRFNKGSAPAPIEEMKP